MDCIFCNITSGNIPAEIIFEDDRVNVFKDIHPKAPVHLLIVPKKHIESIAALIPEDGDILKDMVFAARRVADEMKLKGYRIIINVGREGGQIIDHLHMHLLGGWKGGVEPTV